MADVGWLGIGASEDERGEPRALDSADFAGMFRRHRLDVFRYLRARTLSDEDAADLTATTFERAYRQRDRYRPHPDGPLPWLLRIARNAANDQLRHQATARRGLRFWPMPPQEPDPSTSLLREEASRELAGHVAALPEVQREALRLRYAAGLTARQIGEVIGRSEAATQKILTRALAALKEAYREHE
jgi:RNA polymerase sigma-70 factor (ECF subfamily)